MAGRVPDNSTVEVVCSAERTGLRIDMTTRDETERRAARAAHYRDTAATLRALAERDPYAFKRRAQLHTLAGGFDRLAERLEEPTQGIRESV
jgi:hypothetical protein